MVRAYEQIHQDNLQRIRDLTEPSSVKASMLDQVTHAVRSGERAHSLGFVFPREVHTQEES